MTREQTKRTSDILAEILAATHEKGEITVEDMLKLLGTRAIAIAILLCSLVNSLPMPGIPGFSTVTGAPIVLLGAQLLCGARGIWLPKRIREHKLRPDRLVQRLERFMPRLKKLEKLLKPRLTGFSAKPWSNALGALFMLFGAILALPIPFVNFPMGFSMSLIAAGLIERDGYVIALGLACGAGAVILTFFALDAVGTGIGMLF